MREIAEARKIVVSVECDGCGKKEQSEHEWSWTIVNEIKENTDQYPKSPEGWYMVSDRLWINSIQIGSEPHKSKFACSEECVDTILTNQIKEWRDYV